MIDEAARVKRRLLLPDADADTDAAVDAARRCLQTAMMMAAMVILEQRDRPLLLLLFLLVVLLLPSG